MVLAIFCKAELIDVNIVGVYIIQSIGGIKRIIRQHNAIMCRNKCQDIIDLVGTNGLL